MLLKEKRDTKKTSFNDIYTFSSVSFIEFENLMFEGVKWLILLQNLIQKSHNFELAQVRILLATLKSFFCQPFHKITHLISFIIFTCRWGNWNSNKSNKRDMLKQLTTKNSPAKAGEFTRLLKRKIIYWVLKVRYCRFKSPYVFGFL